METSSKLQVANTILQQLGGNKFIAMTGSKNFMGSENSLSMKLSRNNSGAQYLKIVLTSMDDYTMTFSKLKKTLDKEMMALGVKFFKDELIEVKKIEGVYCDQLQEIFKETTGLYTHL